MSSSQQKILLAVLLAVLVLVGAGWWLSSRATGQQNAGTAAISTPTPGSAATPSPVPPAPPAATQAAAATATVALVQQATLVPGTPGKLVVESDVTYCTGGGVPLLADIYPPQTADTKPAPVVLYVHGGGWTSGDKSSASMWAGLLARRGYLVASINYRLAPQYKWPAQIEDTMCAARFLRANATRYNIDPNRIAAMGDSAGGHLVSLLGLAGPEAGFEGSGGYADQSSTVQAVVDLYGPTDLTAYDVQAESERIAQVLGIPPAQAPAVLKKASPVTYVRKDAPPFFIIQGDKDTLVVPSQSQELYDRLKAVSAPASLLIVKNAGHAFAPVGGQIQPTLLQIAQQISDFLDRTLKRHAPVTAK